MTTPQPFELRPYRRGTGIVLLNPQGHAFVGRRIDTGEPAWQFPQGGIDGDEAPLTAVLREMKEEIGTDTVELLAEAAEWFAYDLPRDLADRAWHGRYRGQRQKWFCFRHLGRDSDIDVRTEHPEFSAWRWMPLAEIPPLIVAFKRDLYDRVVAEFAPVAARLAGGG